MTIYLDYYDKSNIYFTINYSLYYRKIIVAVKDDLFLNISKKLLKMNRTVI
jgi:hypothetical protein